MTIGRFRLKKELRTFNVSKESVRDEIPGILGITIGGSKVVEVTGRAGFVFVRLRDDLSELVQAYNDEVSPVYGLPVIVVRDKKDMGRWRVKERDVGRYDNWSASAYQPDHHHQHEFDPDSIGGDIVWIYSQQFMPHLLYPSGSSAILYPHPYYSSGAWSYSGVQFLPSTLMDYKPTGSNARIVLVYLLGDDTPKLLAGNYLDVSLTGIANVITALPALPTGTATMKPDPIAAIRLVSGTNNLVWSNIYDLRQFHYGW